mmetsp:Transcript_131611/g.319849  ORF Transcript_131611/g.319849 Transcript_131611/m.319849 type:complete len:212 (+) Transcript_131611:308-943(+)
MPPRRSRRLPPPRRPHQQLSATTGHGLLQCGARGPQRLSTSRLRGWPRAGSTRRRWRHRNQGARCGWGPAWRRWCTWATSAMAARPARCRGRGSPAGYAATSTSAGPASCGKTDCPNPTTPATTSSRSFGARRSFPPVLGAAASASLPALATPRTAAHVAQIPPASTRMPARQPMHTTTSWTHEDPVHLLFLEGQMYLTECRPPRSAPTLG